MSTQNFVALLSVAHPMRELQIFHAARVSALVERNDVVDGRGEWVGIAQRLVHRHPTDAADRLGREDPALVFVEFRPLTALFVCSHN